MTAYRALGRREAVPPASRPAGRRACRLPKRHNRCHRSSVQSMTQWSGQAGIDRADCRGPALLGPVRSRRRERFKRLSTRNVSQIDLYRTLKESLSRVTGQTHNRGTRAHHQQVRMADIIADTISKDEAKRLERLLAQALSKFFGDHRDTSWFSLLPKYTWGCIGRLLGGRTFKTPHFPVCGEKESRRGCSPCR